MPGIALSLGRMSSPAAELAWTAAPLPTRPTRSSIDSSHPDSFRILTPYDRIRHSRRDGRCEKPTCDHPCGVRYLSVPMTTGSLSGAVGTARHEVAKNTHR